MSEGGEGSQTPVFVANAETIIRIHIFMSVIHISCVFDNEDKEFLSKSITDA